MPSFTILKEYSKKDVLYKEVKSEVEVKIEAYTESEINQIEPILKRIYQIYYRYASTNVNEMKSPG